MTRLIPPVLDPHASTGLDEAELCSAALDGEVHRLGPQFGRATEHAFHPVDLPVFTEARAAALARGLPSAAALDLDSAAWVHGARRTPPDRPTACFDLGRRSRAPKSSPHRFREVADFDAGTMLVGLVLVTTPLRTALDLLRADEEPDARRRACVRLLLRRRGGEALLRRILENPQRLPHRLRALARVDAIYGRRAPDAKES